MTRGISNPHKTLVPLVALALLCVEARAQPPAQDSAGALILRDRVQLTLAGAQRAIAASRQKALEIDVAVNIAVVDDGGHLLAFARMDGARPGSVYTSMTKATSSATKRGLTGPIPNAESPNTHLSLGVEHAAAQSGGKFTTLLGGVPIVIDDQVIGAIGVGGATGEQDAQVAEAGVRTLTSAVAATAPSESDRPSEATTDVMIYNTWQIEDVDGAGVIDSSHVTIQFQRDGGVSGESGVNRYRGQAKIDGNQVSIGPLAMTRRAGPPALMDQESRFTAALEKTRRFRIDDNGLLYLLDNAGNQLLRASPTE